MGGRGKPTPNRFKSSSYSCLFNSSGASLVLSLSFIPILTRLYDPESNTVSEENYIVPKWPKYYEAVGSDPAYPIHGSKIFCSGHCFLPDGKLLVAGGELENPYPNSYLPIAPDRGLRYSFIFDPEPVVNPGPPDPATDFWSITGPAFNPHIMQKGRWYPTLTLLHNGTVLAMAGLTDEVVPNPYIPPGGFKVLFNSIPEIYNANAIPPGWSSNLIGDAQLPIDIFYSYPYAHVIPLGNRAGKVFYASTQLVPDDISPPNYTDGYSQIFDPFTGSVPF